MALTPTKTWNYGEILTSSDLNAAFLRIYTFGENLSTPATKAHEMLGFALFLDADGDTSISATADDVVDFLVGGDVVFRIKGDVTDPINGITIESTIAGANPIIATTGAEADLGITFMNDPASGEEMLILDAVPTAVNEITIANAATGTNPIIAATSDTDLDIGIDFENDQSEEMLQLASVADGINHLTISNAIAGSRAIIAAAGTGVEVDGGIEFHNDQGEEILILQSAADSVVDVTITSAATGVDATIIASSTEDADAGLTIQGQGVGTVKLGDVPMVFPDADGTIAGQSLVTDALGTMSFQSAMPRNYLSGLQMTRTDANTITISAGECRNTGHNVNMVLAASLAKDIDGEWVAGAGGGLNTAEWTAGTNDCAASTWYHVFLIQHSDGTVDAGFDTQINAGQLLTDSGYTSYRRIGSVRTDTGKDILSFTQKGDVVVWAAPIVETVSTLPDTTARTMTVTVPGAATSGTAPELRTMGNMYWTYVDGTSATLSVYPTDTTLSAAPSETNSFAVAANSTGDAGAGQLHILASTTSTIGYRASAAVNTCAVGTFGYTDWRGRDD